MSEKEIVEIKSNEIADKFQCVPSQINYVINTRLQLKKDMLLKVNVEAVDISVL